MPSVNYSICKKNQIIVHTVEWTVDQFLQELENKVTRELRADKTMDLKADNSEAGFQLKIQFHGTNKDIIELFYLSPNSFYMKASLSICLYNYSDRDLTSTEYAPIQANKWQHLYTLMKCNIIHDKANYLYDRRFENSSFRLKFEFMINCEYNIEFTLVPESHLNDDLEHLLTKGLFSDATMKSATGVEYKVHKNVLSCRSAVLKAHFEHNTTECFTNVVESPFETDVLQEVLTYIYSEKVPRVDEIPEKLLAAADYYQLNRLKSLCEEALHKRLTVENAIETLQLADLHSANCLKQLTLEFIMDGQATLITKTEGWKQFESVKLLKSMYEHIVAGEEASDKPKCKLSKQI